MRLIQEVKKNICDAGFFKYGNTIIIGVSGGPDSVALAHILHDLQYVLGFHLHIAHYNHNLRKSAHADQKYVERMAEQLNVPCTVGHWKNPNLLKKGSLEDAARKRRFQFFKQLTKKINAKAVVLAHTENDLAETVLMHILRGTGLQGLRGILPRRNLGGVCFIRPLLAIKKDNILAFLKKKNIPFCIDPTNKQKKFFRNKIRLELLPLLTKQYNQNIEKLLVNLADNINTDYDCLDQQAQKLFVKLAKYSANKKSVRFGLKSLAKQHLTLKRMLIRIGLKQMKGNTNRLTLAHFREIEDLLQNRPKGSIVHLPGNLSARKSSEYLILSHN